MSKPVAGAMISEVSVLGINKPLSDDLISRIAEESGKLASLLIPMDWLEASMGKKSRIETMYFILTIFTKISVFSVSNLYEFIDISCNSEKAN